jgi:transposase
VPNRKSFLVTDTERKYVGDARDFNNIERRAVIKFFFLQGKAPKEIHAILIETLGEHAPSYATVKNWMGQFKRGYVSTWSTQNSDLPGDY